MASTDQWFCHHCILQLIAPYLEPAILARLYYSPIMTKYNRICEYYLNLIDNLIYNNSYNYNYRINIHLTVLYLQNSPFSDLFNLSVYLIHLFRLAFFCLFFLCCFFGTLCFFLIFLWLVFIILEDFYQTDY